MVSRHLGQIASIDECLSQFWMVEQCSGNLLCVPEVLCDAQSTSQRGLGIGNIGCNVVGNGPIAAIALDAELGLAGRSDGEPECAEQNEGKSTVSRHNRVGPLASTRGC